MVLNAKYIRVANYQQLTMSTMCTEQEMKRLAVELYSKARRLENEYFLYLYI